MLIRLWILAFLISCWGCVTKVENTYYIQGDSNRISAKDTVSAKPDNQGLLDVSGSAYGDVSQVEGK